MIDPFQCVDAARQVRLEIAMETRLGHPAELQDFGIGHALTAQVEGFHAHLDPGVGMLKPPIPQGFDVFLAERDLDHRQEPRRRLNREIIPRR